MKKTMQIVFMLLILVSLTLAQTFERQFDLAMGKSVEVNMRSGGSIEVEGWDNNQVLVRIRNHPDDIEDMVDFDLSSSELEIDVFDGYGNRSKSVNLELFVPNKTDLELHTMGGSMSISKLEGEFSGKTMGGSIELADLKGEVSLTTMGGSITCENAQLDGTLKTMGGSLKFNNVTGDLKATTMGGSISHTRDKTPKSAAKGSKVELNTMGGSIQVDEALAGADVGTMGGKIAIKSAKDYVKAKTMGGDIEISEIDGWVKATTMGGDVTVNMTGDPKKGKRDVDISSMGGEIVLTLPEGISADFDITLTYTKDSKQNYQIKSDFPLEISESKAWDFEQGNARKKITGTGKTKEGKHRIQLETINGDITIKKGN